MGAMLDDKEILPLFCFVIHHGCREVIIIE